MGEPKMSGRFNRLQQSQLQLLRSELAQRMVQRTTLEQHNQSLANTLATLKQQTTQLQQTKQPVCTCEVQYARISRLKQQLSKLQQQNLTKEVELEDCLEQVVRIRERYKQAGHIGTVWKKVQDGELIGLQDQVQEHRMRLQLIKLKERNIK